MSAPQAPERIQGWQHTQMSIARHFGGVNYMGHAYVIASAEPGQPLVRVDVLKAEQEAARAVDPGPAADPQGQLI